MKKCICCNRIISQYFCKDDICVVCNEDVYLFIMKTQIKKKYGFMAKECIKANLVPRGDKLNKYLLSDVDNLTYKIYNDTPNEKNRIMLLNSLRRIRKRHAIDICVRDKYYNDFDFKDEKYFYDGFTGNRRICN